MTPVEIREVVLEHGGDGLIACDIDTPKPGQESVFYGFDLRGWAIGRRGPARSVTVRNGPVELRDVPVDIERPDLAQVHPDQEWSRRSGFFLPIGALRLEPEFELDLRVTLADGAHAPLGTIRGRRTRLTSSFEPRVEPIALTALGRTGSTAVTRLLASHPEVVAYRPFEYEPRVLSYWLDVLQDLSEPASFRRQVTPLGPLEGGWWLGARPPYPRRTVDEEIQSLLGAEGIDELMFFCQQRVDRFYGRVADLAGRPDATRFVEKLGPERGGLVPELYPQGREVFLVRDFRDVVASIFAFNEQRGFQGFSRAGAASDVEYVSGWISESVASFLRAWRARSSNAYLMRYEDLVRRPREALAGALEYLELDSSAASLDAMLESLDEPASEGHRTTAAADSIGRWHRDLDDDVKEACRRSLGEALEQFGYAA